MELTLKATTHRVLEEVERDFQWYNPYTKEMWRGKGGEMRFRYSPALKYSVPYLVDAKDWVMKKNYDTIEAWVKTKRLPILNYSTDFFITVEIQEEQLEELASELYNKKILFDWE